VRWIDAQTFDPESTDGVTDHIYGEQPTGAKPEPTIDSQQRDAQSEVPQ
jgi:hypothetical protein